MAGGGASVATEAVSWDINNGRPIWLLACPGGLSPATESLRHRLVRNGRKARRDPLILAADGRGSRTGAGGRGSAELRRGLGRRPLEGFGAASRLEDSRSNLEVRDGLCEVHTVRADRLHRGVLVEHRLLRALWCRATPPPGCGRVARSSPAAATGALPRPHAASGRPRGASCMSTPFPATACAGGDG